MDQDFCFPVSDAPDTFKRYPMRTPHWNMKVQHKISAPLPPRSTNFHFRKSWGHQPICPVARTASFRRERESHATLSCLLHILKTDTAKGQFLKLSPGKQMEATSQCCSVDPFTAM